MQLKFPDPAVVRQHVFRLKHVWVGLFLAIITWVIFRPVAGCDFTNLDDPLYVTANPHVQDGLTRGNILWAFQTLHAGYWIPLTWLSHMADVQCFGRGAAAAHLVNLGFHVANTVLLFLVLKRMTGALWRPAVVAALFGWHPLRVESVAWVAERKDVLSGFFFMLTLWAYAHFAQKMEPGGEQTNGTNQSEVQPSSRRQPAVRQPEAKNRGSSLSRNFHHVACYYVLALAFFVLGLMSKPMLVTLPAVLLLLDFWPLNRFPLKLQNRQLKIISGLLREKIPFFAISAGFCLMTFLAQRHVGAVQSLSDCSAAVRIDNALVSYLRYLFKTFWPIRLATPYPDPQLWPALLCGAASVLLMATTLAVLWLRKRSPFAVTGWLWFFGMLIPVIGLVQAGAQAMADRFTYLPLIGMFILVVWGTNETFNHWRFLHAWRATIAGLVLLVCAVRTRDQLHYWRNTENLLGHAVAATSNNWIAHYNLGYELDRQGRTDEALVQFEQTYAIKPNDVDTLNELGCLLSKKGRYAEALPYFESALILKPDFSELHYKIAKALLNLGKTDEAIQHYQAQLRYQPDHLASLQGLGIALGLKGDMNQAIIQFQTVLRYQPADPDAHFNLGEAFAAQGKTSEAISNLTEALRLRPGWNEAERELHSLREGAQ